MKNIPWDGMRRPQPPAAGFMIMPAPELFQFAYKTFLNPESPLYNPDHRHLQSFRYPEIAFLWAGSGFIKQGRIILGETEKLMINASGWKKARQELQMYEWFGDLPSFIITLSADFCRTCSDADFCALFEHELYHIAQKLDMYGTPKFNRNTGQPELEMRGHDVEEFVGVARRYGASDDVKRLVKVVNDGPELSRADIAHGCGTCILRVA
jgi:hypothetical protein